MAKQLKQKPLLPVLKEKKRYISYQIHTDVSLPRTAGHDLIKELQKILGIFDSANAGLLPITFDQVTKRGVFRTSLQSVNRVRKALLIINRLFSQHVMIQPIIMSGILKKAKQVM